MPTISPQQESNTYYAVNGPVGNIAEYLLLVYNRDGENFKVPVFTGGLYNVQFYSPEIMNYLTVTGKVVGVSEEAIALSSIQVLDKYGKVCLNANLDKLSGYLSHEVYHIPVHNIAGIQEVGPYVPEPPEPIERRETFVSVLGISSTVCRAVIVKLKIFQDDIQHTVIPVEMEVGRTYHVTWMNHVNHTVYELVGRLIAIDEILLNGSESLENGYVRQDTNQQVGQNRNIYDPNEFYSLPKYNPDGERIKFVFDTSKDFIKLTDSVMLKDIRNVEEIIGPEPPEPPTPVPPFPPIPPCPPPYPPIPPFPPVPPSPPVPPCPPGPWPPFSPVGDNPNVPQFTCGSTGCSSNNACNGSGCLNNTPSSYTGED